MASREQTYIMIKPDGVQRGLIGDIVTRFEKKGFKLVAMKLDSPSKAHLEAHYADLASKKFFPSLISYMLMGPVCCMVWEGDNVVKTGRKMLGATNPKDSEAGTIRGDLCIDVGRNICHGSDSVEAARAEIALWFPEGLNYYGHHKESWVYEKPVKQAVLLGFGNPLLDMSAAVPQSLMDKYEIGVGAALLAEPKHMPLYAEMKENYEVEYIAGGATQNSIRICQALLGPKDDGSTAFIGCVGQDADAGALKTACENAGVAAHYMVDPSTPTGVCAVMVRDTERSLCTKLEAANNYKDAHLAEKEIATVVEAAQFYYISGYFLTVSPPTIMQVAKHASEQGKTMMLNLAAPFIMQVPPFKDALMAAIPYCDIIIGNETEAATFAEAVGLEDKSGTAVATYIAAMDKVTARPRLAIITQGADATVCVTEGKVQEFPVPPVPKAKIIDTNGAGDSFVGGFLARYIKGEELAACVEAGQKAAGMVIQMSGCQLPAGVTNLDELISVWGDI